MGGMVDHTKMDDSDASDEEPVVEDDDSDELDQDDIILPWACCDAVFLEKYDLKV